MNVEIISCVRDNMATINITLLLCFIICHEFATLMNLFSKLFSVSLNLGEKIIIEPTPRNITKNIVNSIKLKVPLVKNIKIVEANPNKLEIKKIMT